MKVTLLQRDDGGAIIRSTEVNKDNFIIGRSQNCDWSFPDIKYLSKEHCSLQNQNTGLVNLLCLSSNGVFVNGKKIRRNENCLLKSNDEICLLKIKYPPTKLVISLKIDEEATDTDSTLEYKTEDEAIIERETSITLGKRPAQSPIDASDTKQVRLEEKPTCSKSENDKNLKSEKLKDNESKNDEVDEDMEENLRCIICQEIFHDCVSCQPCMHSFCGGCYSMWKEKSSDCPTCRDDVQTVSKNHILNNLVAAYLNKHPERKRSAEDIKELDDKNTIKSLKVCVSKKSYDPDSYHSDLFGSTSDSSSEYDSADDELPLPTILARIPAAPVITCRECNTSNLVASSSSTSNRRCRPGDGHCRCACCGEYFPTGDWSNRKCSACALFYCHLYWECRKPGCLGCLNKFKDVNFGDKVFDCLIKNNSYESTILKDYLISNNITARDLLDVCITKMDDGTYKKIRDPESIVCYRCALESFQKLAYEYRKSIPHDQLPATVTSRADCYWGSECRTQFHSQHHASRFNHICDRTRFS